MDEKQPVPIEAQTLMATTLVIAHLGSVLEHRGVISRAELASSFERSAALQERHLPERALVQGLMRTIAGALRSAEEAGPRPTH